MTPNYKIIQGDALEELRKLPDEHVQCVVTSPPYNLVREHIAGGPHPSWDRHRGKITGHQWYDDEVPEEEYQAQQRVVVDELLRVCSGSVFYNHKIRYAIARRGRAILPEEWLPMKKLWCRITWDRICGIKGNIPRFIRSDEVIYMFNRPAAWHDSNLTTVWQMHAKPQGVDHPCPFPIELPARCIRATTDEGMTVLDPYCGAGTTGLAALQMNRNFIGIDITPDYCELSRKRLADVNPLFAKR